MTGCPTGSVILHVDTAAFDELDVVDDASDMDTGRTDQFATDDAAGEAVSEIAP
jgi:hypothetical protein